MGNPLEAESLGPFDSQQGAGQGTSDHAGTACGTLPPVQRSSIGSVPNTAIGETQGLLRGCKHSVRTRTWALGAASGPWGGGLA